MMPCGMSYKECFSVHQPSQASHHHAMLLLPRELLQCTAAVTSTWMRWSRPPKALSGAAASGSPSVMSTLAMLAALGSLWKALGDLAWGEPPDRPLGSGGIAPAAAHPCWSTGACSCMLAGKAGPDLLICNLLASIGGPGIAQKPLLADSRPPEVLLRQHSAQS